MIKHTMKKDDYRETRIRELKDALQQRTQQLAQTQAQIQQLQSLILQTQGGIIELEKEEKEDK